MHAEPQKRFRIACSFVAQGNGCEHVAQIFQNGYTRFAFQCFGVLEYIASALFNKAAMVAGDDLVCAIREKTEGGIAVGILDGLFDREPSEVVMGRIVAQCAMPDNGFTVMFPPAID